VIASIGMVDRPGTRQPTCREKWCRNAMGAQTSMPPVRMPRSSRWWRLLSKAYRRTAEVKLPWIIPPTGLWRQVAKASRHGSRSRTAVPDLSRTSNRCRSHPPSQKRWSGYIRESPGPVPCLPFATNRSASWMGGKSRGIGGPQPLAAGGQRALRDLARVSDHENRGILNEIRSTA
jgi:hypothetical protein